MSTKTQIIKRLDAIKNLIELEDEEMIHLQIDRLKQENNPDLAEIIRLLEADQYESLHEAIDVYVTDFKSSKLTPHQQGVFDEINLEVDRLIEAYDASSMQSDTHFLSLRGSAGVGKTFVTSKLVEAFLQKNYKVVLTTPTHKSLKVLKYMVCTSGFEHVPSRTLHSFLNINLVAPRLNDTFFINLTHKIELE
jgi:flagellar biosynthesis GTPase FlhF